MNPLKVLIVEDNFIIADDLSEILQDLGYEVAGIAASYFEALEMIEKALPDLCVLDITIRGEKDGIDLGNTIKKKYSLPFLYITSHSDKETVSRAKESNPKGYIVKPFDQDDVYTSIEMAISFSETGLSQEPFILIKHKGKLEKLFTKVISHVKSDSNYLEIYTVDNRKYLQRLSLKEFLDLDQISTFCQVHKSYAANLDHVISFNSKCISGVTYEIPIGKKYVGLVKESINPND